MKQDEESQVEEVISKSQRKREMHALQALGKTLTEINASLLAKCELNSDLLEAINQYKQLPNRHEARRRQLKFIGKLMRNADAEIIEKVLTEDKQGVELQKRKFHQLEQTRDELLSGNNQALQQLIADFPDLDIQFVRQLIRQASREQLTNKPPAANRKLFKYLRSLDE